MIVLILSIALFQILAIEFLMYHMMRPSLEEILVMINAPGPLVASLLASFTILIYLYVRPLPNFLAAINKDEEPSRDLIRQVLNRGMNFPYFMAAFAFPFYMTGGYLGAWIVAGKLGWPGEIMVYGFIGGIISALLAVPLSISAYSWLANPVIYAAASMDPDLAPAGAAGLRISLKTKFTIILLSMVTAVAAYIAVVGHQQSSMIADAAAAGEDPGSIMIVYVSLLAVACGLAYIVAFFAGRDFSNPIMVLKSAAEKIEEGEYKEPVRLITNDEMGDLGATINQMMQTIVGQMKAMESVVEALGQGVKRIDGTVTTMLAISADQASGATEQASAVQQSSSIAEQIVSTAKQIAERARTVQDVASRTLSACRDGEGNLKKALSGFDAIIEHMNSITVAMDNLEARFMETMKIVELMQDIADRTELLAINAALEAAGAGQEGKRFGVVAQATRNLALRSEEAAEEIKELVEAIQRSTGESIEVFQQGSTKVEQGGRFIRDLSAAFKNISSFAESTSAAVQEITLSTNQQSTASEELAASVQGVKEVAAKVEQGARRIDSAMTELREFADGLVKDLENDRAGPGK